MIKLKDILLSETASTRAMRDSKEGASKQFVRDFKKAFAKSSKENGYCKLDKKVKSYDVQVSAPAGFDKPITFDKRKGIELDYQVGPAARPGRFPKEYDLIRFKDEMKKGFRGYKIEKTNISTHFWLHKGGNTYHLAYTPAISGTFAMGSSRV